MKSLFIKLMIFAVVLGSCKKDEVKVTASDGTAPKLVASASALVLQQANAADQAIAFNWSASDFGYAGIVAYTLQFAKKGTNFEVVKEATADSLLLAMTVGDVNSLANGLELESGVANDLEVRVKATISKDYFPAAYSNAVPLAVTPYASEVTYPMIYVPGSHQGWDPGSAPPLAAINTANIYEGYVNFGDATTNFKFTQKRDWSVGYGGTSADNAGTLSTKGGDLAVSGAGYYLFKTNLVSNTWTATRTAWSLIGAAAGSWDVDKDMTYDATTRTWKLTLPMVAGEFKFRANHAYDINFGDNKPSDPFLNAGGENIKVPADGTYEVILNLSNPGNYKYSIKKQ